MHKPHSTFLLFALILGILFAVVASPVAAQESEFRLSVNRNFGYSSGAEIRGSFTLAVVGPETIQSVTYLLDGEPIDTISAAPFKLVFQTGDYPFGNHTLSARVQTSDGRTLTTPERVFIFATAEQESAAIRRILGPMGVILVGIVVLVGLSMFLGTRKKPLVQLPPGTPRKYSLSGGGICRHCHRPVPLHWWGINAGVGKYDRCDLCGKWSIFRRVPRQELEAAEAAELAQAQSKPEPSSKSEDEKMRDLLEDSRYTDRL